MVVTHYKLLFRGKALDGHEVGVVRNKLGKTLKLHDGGLEQLFSGRLITLKRGLEQAEAVKYQALLEQLGAEVLLQPDSDAEAMAVDPGATSETVPDAPASQQESLPDDDLVCPRCGYGQPVATECSHCKMDLRLHLKRLQRKARAQQRRLKGAASA